MYWFQIILYIVSGIAFGEIGAWTERRKHNMPFKWSCMEDDCVFNISASHWEGLMHIADGHLEAAHGIVQE